MIATAVSWRLEIHDSLASTSAVCRAAAEAGAPPGLAVIARQQTAGRGTNGRAWASPRGNLYLSVLLRPDMPVRDAPLLGPKAGEALVAALASFSAKPLTLKHPNDILIDGAKLAGILVESATSGDRLDWLVIGIGVNLAVAPALADRETARLGPHDPETVAHAILHALSDLA